MIILDKKCNLEWHSYADHLRNMMKEMLMNDSFSDVILVTEDKKHIKAHLNILSACSPFFKDILEKQNNSIIYLRGIYFEEVESIMQFIYLGKTSLKEELLTEFLSVARSLEIMELSNVETSSNEAIDDKPPTCDMETLVEESKKEETFSSEWNDNDVPEETKNQCDNQSPSQSFLPSQIRTKYEGVQYACDQCDYQTEEKTNLTHHIQIEHEGEGGKRFACSQCVYVTTRQSTLKAHIQSKHEGVEYNCDQCDFKASWKASLRKHKIQSH